MKSWSGALIVAAVGSLLIALGWVSYRPRPTLNGIDRLLSQGRFDEGELRLKAFLAANPGHQPARLLLAGVYMDRPDPKPELALKQLKLIKPVNLEVAAQRQLTEGKALFSLDRFADSEKAFKEARRLNPTGTGAVWGLLNQYSLQDRFDDTRDLSLELQKVVPSRRERVQLLLGIIHFDVLGSDVAAGSRVFYLKKAVDADPGDYPTTLALGAALVRYGKTESGLGLLRHAVNDHPDDIRALQLYVKGLRSAGETDELARVLEHLPSRLQADPRFDLARGQAAQARRDTAAAVRFYRRACDADPFDKEALFRLVGALRTSGQAGEAAQLEPRIAELDYARRRLDALYQRAAAANAPGAPADVALYQELADTLDSLGRREEARAWRRVVSRDQDHSLGGNP